MTPNFALPENEKQRMAAVDRYDVLDTPADGTFDRITELAARLLAAPISIISIVDHDRIWLKSHYGIDGVEEIPREPGLCASAIFGADPYIVNDAPADPKAMANSLVAGAFGLRFYVGVPLRTHDGFNLGTLCVIDRLPRTIEQGQIDDLTDLACIVMDQMELRLAARRAVSHAKLMAREIDHRVMNSLQFVSTLLSIQSRSASDGDAAAQLRIASGRIASIARVHRHFYTEETEVTSCTDFLRRLCAELSNILGLPIEVTGANGRVSTTQIQAIGLIVNELVSNAAKHADGPIVVAYLGTETGHELSVVDHGKGLPADFDPQESSGLGMKVVTSQVEQLAGSLSVRRGEGDRGTRFSVTFPAGPLSRKKANRRA